MYIDLSGNIPIPLIVIGVIALVGLLSGCSSQPTATQKALPYEPEVWNDGYDVYNSTGTKTGYNIEGIQYNTNCYAYAINYKKASPYANDRAKPTLQPGDLSGKPYSEYEIGTVSSPLEFCQIIGDNIVAACIADAKAVGGYFSANKPSIGEYYAVVLVVGAKFDSKGVLLGFDYHWYRQNSDGTWSHKRGQSEVNCLDASGNVIYDPYKADRDYSKEGNINYSHVVGLFYVMPGVY